MAGHRVGYVYLPSETPGMRDRGRKRSGLHQDTESRGASFQAVQVTARKVLMLEPFRRRWRVKEYLGT